MDDLLNLVTEIERYVHSKGLKRSDSINTLIEAMVEDCLEDE
jgi:uncharacterized protein YqgV (UPF0045/DUF77 family)